MMVGTIALQEWGWLLKRWPNSLKPGRKTMATLTTGFDNLLSSTGSCPAADSTFYARRGKRLFDIAASLLGLVVSSPLLFVCALLVRLTSPGPVLFRQARVGYRGRRFTLIKFRTMVHGAESTGAAVVVRGDPRLTRVGTFMRISKLDELPQLINVLRGDMSFVGPRPRVPNEVDIKDPRERVLLGVRPGITSCASIHHRREADYCARQANPQAVYRTNLLPQKRWLDCEYVYNLSLRLDLKLLLMTLILLCAPERAQGSRLGLIKVRLCTRHAQMLLDLGVYVSAALLAYTFRYEAGFQDFYRRQMWLYIAFIPPMRVLVNRCLGIYDMMWRYVTLEDTALLAVGLAPNTLILYALRLGLPTSSWRTVIFLVPLSIITLEYLLALSASLGLRYLRRMLYVLQHHYQPLPERARRVLILGAGLLGLTTAQDIRQYPHISLVGFVDDDPAKHRRLMAGCRVLGHSTSLEALCSRHKVTDVLVCAKSIDPGRLWELDRRCAELKVRLHIRPALDQVLHAGGKVFV